MKRLSVLCVLSVVLWFSDVVAALPMGEALTAAADRLVTTQIKSGSDAGSWPEARTFTGTVLAGMVGAYEDTCDGDYATTIDLAGNRLLQDGYNPVDGYDRYYPEEAYALVRLGEARDPAYRARVAGYFNYVKTVRPGGTAGLIALWDMTPPSGAVLDMAHYAVAAYAVNAADRALWRDAILRQLRRVSDSTAEMPALALCVATWGLTLTGPMDSTRVDPSGVGQLIWRSVTLADLPTMVVDHQVAGGEFVGSFYWRLDKTDGGSPIAWRAGYTEDAVFGTLAMVACQERLGMDLSGPLARARTALLAGIDVDGRVRDHLLYGAIDNAVYAGEMVRALGALTSKADLSLDGWVDAADYSLLVDNWGATGCGGCSWCGGADIDRDGVVGFSDLKILVGTYWLTGVGP